MQKESNSFTDSTLFVYLLRKGGEPIPDFDFSKPEILLPGFYALVDHSFDESAAKNDIVQCWCDSHFGRRRRRRKRNPKKKKVNHYSNRRKFRVACRLRNECTGRRTKPPRKRCRKKQTGRNGEMGNRGNAYGNVETPPHPSVHASCGDGENAAIDHEEVNSSTFLKRGMQFISTRIHAFFAGSESEQNDESVVPTEEEYEQTSSNESLDPVNLSPESAAAKERLGQQNALRATVGTTNEDDAALSSSSTHSEEESVDPILCLPEFQGMHPSDVAEETKEIRRQNVTLLTTVGTPAGIPAGDVRHAGFVTVNLVSGNASLAVSVSLAAPVAELKSHLSRMSEIGNPSPDEQCLLFNGQLLQNDLSLFQYNIGNGDVMYLVKNECIQVIVSSDTTIALTVRSATTIASLKDAIFAETGIVPDEQRLSFGATLLWRDDRTLIEYNVGHNSTLNLQGRLRGGGVTQAPQEQGQSFKRSRHMDEDEQFDEQKRHKKEIGDALPTFYNFDLSQNYYTSSDYSYLSGEQYPVYLPSNKFIAQPSSSNDHPSPSTSLAPSELECAFSESSVISSTQLPTSEVDAITKAWYGEASTEEVIAEFDSCGCTFYPDAKDVLSHVPDAMDVLSPPPLRPTVHTCGNDDSSSAHDFSLSGVSPHEQQQQPSSSAIRSPDTHNCKETFRSVKVKVQVEDESVEDDLVAKLRDDSEIKVKLRVDNDLVTMVDDKLVAKDLCAHVPAATRDRSNLSPSFTLPEPVTTGLGTERISCDEYYNTRLALETGVQKAISATLAYDEESNMLDCAKRYLINQWNAHNDFVASGCKSPPSRTHPLAYHKEMGDIINATGKFIANLGELATLYSRLLAVMHYATMSEKGFKHSDPNLMHNKVDRNSPCPNMVAVAWASAAWYHTTGMYEKGKDRPEVAIIDCIPILLEKGKLAELKEQCRAFLKEFGVLEYFDRKGVSVYDAMFVIMVPIFAHNVDQITYNNNNNPASVVAVGGESAKLFINRCKATTPSVLGRGSTIHPDAATDGMKQFQEQVLVDSDACITAAMRDVLQADLERVGLSVNALQCFISWRLKFRGLSDEEILLLAESLMCTVLHNVSQAVVAVMQKGESRADVADSFTDVVLKEYNLTRRMVQIYVKLCRTHEGKGLHKVSYAVNSEMPNYPDKSRVQITKSFDEDKLKEYDLTKEMVQEYVKHMDLHKVSYAVIAEKPNYPDMSKAAIAEAFDDAMRTKYGLTEEMVQKYVKHWKACRERAVEQVSYAVNSEMPNCHDMSRVQIAESFGEDKLKEYDLTQEMVQEYVKHMDLHNVSYAVIAEMPSATEMTKADVAESFDAETLAKYNLTQKMVQKYVKHWKACEKTTIRLVSHAVDIEKPNYPDMSNAAIAKAFTPDTLAKYNLTEEMVQKYVKFCKACGERTQERALRPVIRTIEEVKDALEASSTKADKLTRLHGISAVSTLRGQITSLQVGGMTKLASFRLSVPAHWRGQGVPDLQVIIVEPDHVKEPLHAAMKSLLAGMETDSDFSVMDWTEIADVMYRLFDGEYLTAMEVKDALEASSTKADKLTRLHGISAVSTLRRQITSVQVGGKTNLASIRLSVPAHWRGQGVPDLQVIIVEPDHVKEPLHAAMKSLLAGMETDSDFSVMDWTEIADVMYRLFDGEYLTAMEVKDALEASSTLDGKRAKLRDLLKIVSLRRRITRFKVGGATKFASFQLQPSVTKHWQGRGAPKKGQVFIVESDNAKESVRVALCALLKGMKTDSIYCGMDWGAIKNELSFLFGA